MIDYAALRTEVLRVHLRYAQEVVDAFNFCPWAREARSLGKVRTDMLFGREPTLERALAAMRSLTSDPTTDVGLLVLPELTLDRVAFQHFAARLRELDAATCVEQGTPFAIVDFHPDVDAELASPERLVAFIRRSPDPTLQLVRRTALQAVRLGEDHGTRFVDLSRLDSLATLKRPNEPLHARIARANFNTVQRVGLGALRAVLEDILQDRNQSYARAGLTLREGLSQKQEMLDLAE